MLALKLKYTIVVQKMDKQAITGKSTKVRALAFNASIVCCYVWLLALHNKKWAFDSSYD
jgi:hypothetical protein